MSHRVQDILKLLFCVGLLAGCAQIPKAAGFPEVEQMVHERVSYRIHWNQGTPEDAAVAQAIQEALREELSLDTAIQIALLNNRSLQATYEELGMSQADVVQAGLLRNPSLFASARFPNSGPFDYNLEFEIIQDFLDILMRPVRKQLATVQFEQTKLRVGHEVLRLVTEVQTAYFTLLGAQQVAAMRQAVAETTQTAAELAQRMYDAGNISDLELTNQRGFFEQARIEWATAEAEILAAREQLNTLLGLWGQETNWKLAEQLPEIPPEEIRLEELESLAVAQRLDLAAAQREIETLGHALSITRKQWGITSVEVAVNSERDTDGTWLIGPNLQLELPIFHQRQSQIARLEAQFRQSTQRRDALAIAIRSEVRALRDRLLTTRRLVEHYRDVLLPLRERIVELTQQQYNFMLSGAFELILAKQIEFDAYQAYLEAIRDYWITRAQLQQAVGGRLPVVTPLGQLTISPSSHTTAQQPHKK